MFLALSKTLDLAAEPIAWVLALLTLALVARRRARLSAALVAAALVVLGAFSTAAVANRLVGAVEGSAVRTYRADATYDAVIVLSGMVDDDATRASGTVQLTDAVDRIVAGVDLLRRGGAREILLSGGSPYPVPGDRPEPQLLAELLRSWGIDPARIVVEAESRNTHENAAASTRIARARGWRSVLLVTSAYHMQRALGCFRKEGLSPDALPVDWHRRQPTNELVPRVYWLRVSSNALHELVGRIVYRLMGYT